MNATEDPVDLDHAIRAMGKEEILACSDISYLANRMDEYEERAIVLKTFLEHPAEEVNQNAWHRRTRGALIMFKVAIYRIDKRIKALHRASRQNGTIDGVGLTTTSRERREARREADRVSQESQAA